MVLHFAVRHLYSTHVEHWRLWKVIISIYIKYEIDANNNLALTPEKRFEFNRKTLRSFTCHLWVEVVNGDHEECFSLQHNSG